MERFFTIVQRINSILILLLVLAAALAFLWNLIDRPERRHRGEVAVAAPEGGNQKDAVRLHFGELQTIAGADTQMLELEARTAGGKFSSGGSSETRNILFLSGEARARWLFDKHTNLILVAQPMSPEAPSGSRKEKASLLYFEFVPKDSDGDGRLDREDEATVALSRPDGTRFTPILHGVDRVLARELVGERVLGIVYQKGKALLYGKYAVDSFRRISEQTIAELPERL